MGWALGAKMPENTAQVYLAGLALRRATAVLNGLSGGSQALTIIKSHALDSHKN
jgi:hypothetical protein